MSRALPLLFASLLACAPKAADAPADPRAEPAPASAAPRSTREGGATAAPTPAQPSQPAAPPRSATLELAFVGDVIFGRYRGENFDPIPEDGHEVFAEIQPDLEADVLVGNLETPLMRELPATSPIGARFRFGASREHAQHLVTAGFDAMSLANNHWYDQRTEGVEQSPLVLNELGIAPLGAAHMEAPFFRVDTVEKNGWKLAFIAITTRTNSPIRAGLPVVPYLSTNDIRESIVPLVTQAKTDHDLVIVVVHWGDEYAEQPSSTQVKAAHALIDAGAALVIGHHPHVLQAVERYGTGLIAYSMGNFLFENTHELPRLTGVLHVRMRDEGRCIERAAFHPAYIKRTPVQHPVPATGGMGKRVRERVTSQGKAFDTTWTQDGEDLVLVSPSCG
jgi:Bacterial capsule synthesis protein PGA_cap